MNRAGTVLLIHGGLWEEASADWFWRTTGVVAGLERRGLRVLVPDRLRRAPDWAAEARHLAATVNDSAASGPVTVVGGSFGCAAAVRLALDFRGLASRLVLAWPASLRDQFTAIAFRSELARQGAVQPVLDALLGTETLPSAADAEIRTLELPAAILPPVPANPVHPRAAADALLRLLPSAVELPGCPEPPRPEFPRHRDSFLDAVAGFARRR